MHHSDAPNMGLLLENATASLKMAHKLYRSNGMAWGGVNSP